ISNAYSLQTAKFLSISKEFSWMMHLWKKAIKHKKGYTSQHTGTQSLLRICYPHAKQKSEKEQKIQQDEEGKIIIPIAISKIHWYWQRILSSNSTISTGISAYNTKKAKQGRQLSSSYTYRDGQSALYHLRTYSKQDRAGTSSATKQLQATVAGKHGATIDELNKKFRARVSFRDDIFKSVTTYDVYRCEQMDKWSAKTRLNVTKKVINGVMRGNTCTVARCQLKWLILQLK
ncbi:hypothetical protein A4A49_58911, partial [Nicotiana attenuata]